MFKMSISTRTKIAKYAYTANGYKELTGSISLLGE